MSRKMAIVLRGVMGNSHIGDLNITKHAKALGVTRPFLSNLLNGKHELSIDMAKKIERLYRYDGLALLKIQLEEQYKNHGETI